MYRIGHRGAMGYGHENTIASFEKAIALEVDMIELNVQFYSTGELVVIHDIRVNRTTNGKGYVNKLSLKELKSLNAGKNEKISTLDEILDVIDKRFGISLSKNSSFVCKLQRRTGTKSSCKSSV